MFNKGKAFLLSVLGSIALMAVFTLIEIVLPFEETFHFSSTAVGWHTAIWIGVLFYFIDKYKQDKNYKTVKRVLLFDFILCTFVLPIGFQKSIYDIQKFKVQKQGLTITNGTCFQIFAWLLYIIYILFYIVLIVAIVLGPDYFRNLPEKIALKEFETMQKEVYSECLKEVNSNKSQYKEGFCDCMFNSIRDAMVQAIRQQSQNDSEPNESNSFDKQKWINEAKQKMNEDCKEFILKKNDE